MEVLLEGNVKQALTANVAENFYEGDVTGSVLEKGLSKRFTFTVKNPLGADIDLTIKDGDKIVVHQRGDDLSELSPQQGATIGLCGYIIIQGVNELRARWEKDLGKFGSAFTQMNMMVIWDVLKAIGGETFHMASPKFSIEFKEEEKDKWGLVCSILES